MALSDLLTLDAVTRTRRAEPKVTKHAARVERKAAKDEIRDKEGREKTKVRKRDGWMCRFPRCACHKARLHPEVAHGAGAGAKGMGGDHGLKSTADQMLCLCRTRHREGRISIHAGTLKWEALTKKGTHAKVRWWVDVSALDTSPAARGSQPAWCIVATETRPCYLVPLTNEQGELLERIAEMKS